MTIKIISKENRFENADFWMKEGKRQIIKKAIALSFGFADVAMVCPICDTEQRFWSFQDNPSICLRCKLKSLGE